MSEILLAVVLGGSLWIWISTVLKASTVSTVLSVKIQISTIYKEFLEKKIDQKKLGINVGVKSITYFPSGLSINKRIKDTFCKNMSRNKYI